MRYNFTFLLFFISFAIFAQEEAWVYFNAKPNAQAFFSNPLSELSQRALDRRTNQNIVLDLTDAPLETSFVNQIKSSTGITVMAQSKWLNALHIRGTQTNINALKGLSFVAKVEFADKSLNTTAKKSLRSKNKSNT
ncbi:hypothetical protein AAFH68_44830 [Flavobacterium sp. CGRL1]